MLSFSFGALVLFRSLSLHVSQISFSVRKNPEKVILLTNRGKRKPTYSPKQGTKGRFGSPSALHQTLIIGQHPKSKANANHNQPTTAAQKSGDTSCALLHQKIIPPKQPVSQVKLAKMTQELLHPSSLGKTKKSVSFRGTVQIKMCPHLKDYTNDEIQQCWYSRKEIKQMKRRPFFFLVKF